MAKNTGGGEATATAAAVGLAEWSSASMSKGDTAIRSVIRAAALAAGIIALLLPAPASAGNITSTFFNSSQGWTVSGGTAHHQPGDGLPPGDFAAVDDSGGLMTVNSPASWDGDYSANYGGSLSFDIKTNSAPTDSTFIVSLSTGLGQAFQTQVASPTPVATFFHRSIPIDESHFQFCTLGMGCSPTTPAEIKSELGMLGAVTMLVDFSNGTGENVTLDNISLTEPAPPAAPSSAATQSPAVAAAAATKCPKGKKLVVKKGKRKCKKRRKK
jgi:hypothetical protein